MEKATANDDDGDKSDGKGDIKDGIDDRYRLI